MKARVGVGYQVEWKVQKFRLTRKQRILKWLGLPFDPTAVRLVQELPWHKNLVVDAGLEWRAENTDVFTTGATFAFPYIAVGTDDTAATAGDTTLTAEFPTTGRKIHGSSVLGAQADLSTYTVDDSDPNAPFVIIGTEFGLLDCVTTGGDPIIECGLFTASSAGTMFCHEILSETIDKSYYDYLRVYAKVTVKRLSNTFWTRTRDAYEVKGVITDAGLARCLDQTHWDSSMMDESAPLDFGDDDTDPVKTDAGLVGTTCGLTVTGTWKVASGATRSCECVCDFDEGSAAPGTSILEAIPLGATTPTCEWRMTFDDGDTPNLGIVKLDTNCLFFTVTYTVAAV